jgi:hypothetical protein
MLQRMKNAVALRLSPTRAHWSGLRQEFTARLQDFRHSRDTGPQDAMARDFTLLLDAWGIEDEADIPRVLRDLRLRCLLLALPVAVAVLAALFTPGFLSLLTLALLAPPCLFGLLTARWRMSVLRHRAFIPFHRWLTASFIKKGASQ